MDDMTVDDEVLDRAVGAMLGVHAGDSLGASVEFDEPATIARKFPGGVREIVGGGPFGWAPGEATDDTDLTWAIAQGYLEDPNDVVAAAGRHMVAWFNSGPRDIGNTTSESLARLARTGDPKTSGSREDGAQANGSLMRTMPVAVARLDDPERLRIESRALSAITHAHPVCLATCETYCELAAYLISGADPRPVVDLLVKRERNAAVKAALLDAKGCATAAELQGPTGGFVLWSFRLAVWAVLNAPDVQEGLVGVIALGHDTDTNAAIAGGLLGAHFGAESIPERWRSKLQFREEFEDFVHQILDAE
jgi:ADP-ribosylglycohydrolase